MSNALKADYSSRENQESMPDGSGLYDDKAARLEYIKQMLDEMVKIADATRSPTLVYLLRMSALEAEDCRRVHQFKTEIMA